MSSSRTAIGFAAAAAMIALSSATVSSPALAKGGASVVHCYGVNSCKGQSDCKSGNHDCTGQNDCKGQGFKELSSKTCKAKGGSLNAPTN